MDDGDHPQGDVVHGQLVIAGAQGPALLVPAYHPLDDVPPPVGSLIEGFIARLVFARGDDILDVVPPQPRARRPGNGIS